MSSGPQPSCPVWEEEQANPRECDGPLVLSNVPVSARIRRYAGMGLVSMAWLVWRESARGGIVKAEERASP